MSRPKSRRRSHRSAAAMAAITVFNDDDDFEVFNPHPYGGGYDIAATYGFPLPPSTSTCYPIPSLSALPEPSPAPDPSPVPEPAPNPVPAASLPPPAVPAEDGPVRPPDYVGRGGDYRPAAVESFLADPSSSWGFPACGVREQPYWAPWKRAAEWLFGYSQGYGDRRIGVDRYGIPIYASRNGGHGEPLRVLMEPAADAKLDCYDGWSSDGHGFARHEPHSGAQSSFSCLYEDATPVYNDSYTPSHRSTEEKGYFFYENTSCSYERHCHEQPLSVALQPMEHGFSMELDQLEVYEQPVPPESSWYATSRDSLEGKDHFYANSSYAYESNGQLDRLERETSEGKDYYAYESNYHENPLSMHNDSYDWFEQRRHDHVDGPEGYARSLYGQGNPVELEPYQPTWSRYPSYYESQFHDSAGDRYPTSSYGHPLWNDI